MPTESDNSESGIKFDFSSAVTWELFDNGNRPWKPVDFIIETDDEFIWLEVKNWANSKIPAHEIAKQEKSFIKKMGGDHFFKDELLGKFLGTSSELLHTMKIKPKPIIYVVILESPQMTAAIKQTANEMLKQLMRPNYPWAYRIDSVVLTLADWNSYYSQYPAHVE